MKDNKKIFDVRGIREAVFIMLYQHMFTEADNDTDAAVFAENWNVELSDADIDEVRRRFEVITAADAEILETVRTLSPKRALTRIPKILLSILKTGIGEMKLLNQPYKMVINECVELAKNYGDGRDYAFVNAVLDTYRKNASSAG